MCKKTIHLMLLVFSLMLTSVVSAATISWDNGGAGPLWSVPANWDPDGVPTAPDELQFYVPDANCLIDASVTAECKTFVVGMGKAKPCYLDMTGGTLVLDGNFQIGQAKDSNGVFIMSAGTASSTAGRLWVGMNGKGDFIMRGGILNIYDKVEIGKNAAGNGTVYMEGGIMNLTGNSTDLEIGSYGRGTLHMTGGIINLQDTIKLSQGNATTTTGVGRINLYGGTLNASQFHDPTAIYGNPKLDITEGTLVLTGDDRARVNDYINRGWIVAYDSNGVVDVTWTADPNRTTVTGRMLDSEFAWGPTPRNRAVAEQPAILKWNPGVYAVSHDVYFGTGFDDVNDASRENPGDVLASMAQSETTFDPGRLVLGQTYYWRVDEVNDANAASPWKGTIFQFTVTNYVVVDNFESYNDLNPAEEGSHRVYYTWQDGYDNQSVNGGVIGYIIGESFMEKKTVHGGVQSVPVSYDNTVAQISEVSVNPADLPIGSDWTQDNLSTLSLWFYGALFNGAEQMYVKLNGVKVLYPGPATDLRQTSWLQWNIPLADFKTDLKHVTHLTIGFSRTDAWGGYGRVFLDDIRLYPPAN